MNWINLNVTVLDSEEFLGAEPTERATWICLLRYCAGQENGGRIVGCRHWKDRKWQQVARVTLAEIQSHCALFRFEGDDLVVTFYPSDKEEEVKQKREHAKTNGSRGGRPRKPTLVSYENQHRFPTEPTLVTDTKPTLVPIETNVGSFSKAEGERKEKGKEGELNLALEMRPLCTLEQAVSYAPMARRTPDEVTHWWHVRNAGGWMKSTQGGTPVKITSWQSDLTAAHWIGESMRKSKRSNEDRL